MAGNEAKTDLEQLASQLRAFVQRENDVANQRTAWLLFIQSILFTATAILLHYFLLPAVVIAIVGLLIAVSMGHALRSGFNSRMHFKQLWKMQVEKGGFNLHEFLPLDGGYPEDNSKRWLLPWLFLPPMLAAAWVVLIVYCLLLAF